MLLIREFNEQQYEVGEITIDVFKAGASLTCNRYASGRPGAIARHERLADQWLTVLVTCVAGARLNQDSLC